MGPWLGKKILSMSVSFIRFIPTKSGGFVLWSSIFLQQLPAPTPGLNHPHCPPNHSDSPVKQPDFETTTWNDNGAFGHSPGHRWNRCILFLVITFVTRMQDFEHASAPPWGSEICVELAARLCQVVMPL
jgi:hypothetical protein